MKTLMKKFNLLLTLIGTMFLFTVVAQASTYTVNSTADTGGTSCPDASGQCTLRQAINAANNQVGSDFIHFKIPGGGVHTIIPLTFLPFISGTVDIDGYTQPGAKANTLAQGDDAVLLIEINGAAFMGNGTTSIFSLGAPNCTIRGLVLNRSAEYGIYISSGGSGSIITGNFIGTDPTGVFAQPNGYSGIYIDNSSNNLIGGDTPAARNILSGNTYPNKYGAGISIRSSAHTNTVQGNFIGTNKNGNFAINNNQAGVAIEQGSYNNTIGGTTAGARNIISGNAATGVFVAASSSNLIEGNFIGTDVTGNAKVPNNGGVIIAANSTSNKIGDTGAGAGNVISGNAYLGISIFGDSGSNPTFNEVFGNFIGTKADGVSGLGNGTSGVELGKGANFNLIGSFLSSTANVIAYNGTVPGFRGSGVRLTIDAGTGNNINGNSIHSNQALGIDLSAPADTFGQERTLNDLNDGDTGANGLQNFPVITSAVSSNGTTTITGTLNSVANEPFRIEFFVSPICNDSGYGEGKTYLGSTDVSTSGNNAGFSVSFPGSYVGQFAATTATDLGPLSTSEFSQCKQVTAPQLPAGNLAFSSSSYSVGEGGGVATVTATRTGGSGGAVSVHYQTGGGTATANSDYTPASGTLSWNDGDAANKTFTIPITDDNLDEPDETIALTLSSPTGGATLVNQSSAALTITDNDPQPSLSISDVSLAEGNSGLTGFNFNVTLSGPSGQTVTVNYGTIAGGTATLGIDYQPTSGTLTFAPGDTSKPVAVMINGDTQDEPNETFLVQLSNQTNATLSKAQGTGTIVNDDAVAAPAVQFSAATYSVQESLTAVTITVTRTGDTSGTTRVDYATADGTATQKSDYEIASGTLTFGPGDTTRSFQVLINEDSYVEGTETVNLALSNPAGASLGAQSTAHLNIGDDSPESLTNPIDDPQSFVYLHYHDFLNREPDQAGLQFWTNGITACGQDAACVTSARVNVSAAYFLSIEFQQTGFLLHLMQKESFGALPKYANFMRDLQEVSQGVVVNSPGWEQKLAANQQQFAEAWVNRSGFKAAYDGLSNAAYVNALYANAGVVPPQAEHDGLVTALDTATQTRVSVLLEVTANAAFRQQEQNSAFVLMQYFGYLRRDPDSGPDSDLSGYYFWLQKLNSFNGDYQQAEMVKAFLDSLEYRGRFGQ